MIFSISNQNDWIIADGDFFDIRCIILLNNKTETNYEVVYLCCTTIAVIYDYRIAIMTYSVQNNEQDYLAFGHASLKEYGRSWTDTTLPQRNLWCGDG